ncbi:nucleoside hydrolase [Diaminobutyricibacter sp. McL0618]|uniref:nucleoside hydrolase n=1 Tax=Leifsonia sp. McL0618 TaxID=3415677 RepID=UPI003CF06A13
MTPEDAGPTHDTLPTAVTRRPVYFDCDTGVDDALALAYLLASPEVELVGIGSVSGNTDAAQAARNTLDLLALAGHPEIPVAVGAHDPLVGTYAGGAPEVHGANGIGGVELPPSGLEPVDEDAASMLVRLSHEYDGELTVLAVGPLANLANALELDPSIASRVREVIVMGGAVYVPGNVGPVAEANVWHDPEAAQAVVEAAWPLTLVPLDVTLQHLLEEPDRERLLGAVHPLPRSLGTMLEQYFGYYVSVLGRRGCGLHDPLAAAIVAGGLATSRSSTVVIEVDVTDGPERGRTRAVDSAPTGASRPVTVVLETDRPLAPHLLERVLAEFG